MARLFYGSAMSNGVRIHYYRTGEEKPPIVLLHGITDNGLCWNKTALMLEPDFDVIMIDARGHGLSDAPETGYTYEEQAADVAAVIQNLGIQPPVVIGHSMGANTAAITAARYPELVRALILEDPPWQAAPDSDEARIKRGIQLRSNVEQLRSKTIEELLEIGRSTHPNWEKAELEVWARAKKQMSPELVHITDTPRTPWREIVRQIKCPVLLITGDPARGGIVTPEVAEEVSRLVKKTKVVQVPNAGHNIRRDQFDPFFDAVAFYLARR